MWKIICVVLLSCSVGTCHDNVKNSKGNGITSENIPDCVRHILPSANWCIDTICVANGKVYCSAYEDYTRTMLLYNEDKVLLENPTLEIDSVAPIFKTKFKISIAGNSIVIDFADSKSLDKLSTLGTCPKHFTRYKKEYWENLADSNQTTLYAFNVDFPDSLEYSTNIMSWLIQQVNESQTYSKEAHVTNASYVGKYSDKQALGKFVADRYFMLKKAEYDNDYYPSILYFVYDMRARIANDRFVTYQKYTNNYEGSTHGYSTESLISFDPVHNQVIDCEYLFRPECLNKVKEIFLTTARNHKKFLYWENINSMDDVKKHFMKTDDNNNLIGSIEQMELPQPGLGENGVVFSFQPYDISCFAAGCFHFIVPYDKLKSYLTDQAKWCLKIN